MDLAGTEALHRASPAATLAALARRVEEEIFYHCFRWAQLQQVSSPRSPSDLDKPRGFAVIGPGRGQDPSSPTSQSACCGAWARPCKSASARTALFGSESWPVSTKLNLSRVTARSDDGLSLCARGEDDRRVDPGGKVKSISSETTLDKDTAETRPALRPILWQLTETVGSALEKRPTSLAKASR